MTTNKISRCPITGQVGVCPSQAISSVTDTADLSPQEQQANLWQSLLERNGHPSPPKKQAPLEEPEDKYPPQLIHASKSSFSDTSDSDSLSSSEPTVTQQRTWPTYDQVSAHVLVADYRASLTSGVDQHAVGVNTKLLCPHGVVCQAKLELFDAPPGQPAYTGLLTPGTTVEHCLLRLSSALRPVDHGGGAWAKAVARRTFGAKLAASQILPAAALKCFRKGQDSGNLLLMGSKVGQPTKHFFEHALCTAVTEKIPALGLPFLRRFSRYSKYPLALGLSELCQYDAQGEETDEPNFPFALCLQPVVPSTTTEEGPDRPFDAFIEDIPREIAPGTHLFDIYCAPTPESIGAGHELQRIGRVVSTSSFVYSSPTDGLTFRHQVKEDDLNLRDDWEERMNTHVVQAPDGTKGTAGKLTGWQIFEDNILQGRGDYIDFEKPKERRKKVSFADEPMANRNHPVRVQGWKFCGYQKAQVKVSASS